MNDSLLAWVIERGDSRDPLGSGRRQCLGTTSKQTGGVFLWHDHFAEALRFATKEDAEKFVVALRRAMEVVPQRDVLDGFRMGDPMPEVLDHMWCGGPTDRNDNLRPVPEPRAEEE